MKETESQEFYILKINFQIRIIFGEIYLEKYNWRKQFQMTNTAGDIY